MRRYVDDLEGTDATKRVSLLVAKSWLYSTEND